MSRTAAESSDHTEVSGPAAEGWPITTAGIPSSATPSIRGSGLRRSATDWGWRKELGDRTWGRGYYHELLPAICAENDPTRPYWPGSPYSGSPELHPQDPARGTIHIWDVWNRAD
ncbi:hypothetical protein [Streptomyces sp. NPDC005181]|uniref:hypothetical protein n=1 Tax=Streptomyces sp. NPDC005181 TaxID=3156869 RepID=UPI0033A4D781